MSFDGIHNHNVCDNWFWNPNKIPATRHQCSLPRNHKGKCKCRCGEKND